MDVVNARRRNYHINIIDVMSKTDLTQFDIIPDEMKMYLSYYGPHFNRKCCEFAISQMYKDDNEEFNESDTNLGTIEANKLKIPITITLNQYQE